MTLFESLKIECVKTGLAVSGKEELLQNIARLAKTGTVLEAFSENEIFEALMQREKLGSTGFENGVAIPHCRLKGIQGFIVGMITIPAGVDFSSSDGSPTRICFFIIGPANLPNEHMRVLSMIARTCSLAGIKEKVLAAATSEQARDIFLGSVPATIKANQVEEKSLVTVFVQVEEAFMDILQVLTSSPAASVAVIEANDPSNYLHKLPLFATFWNSEEEQFHRIITGVISRKLANELVREINVVADKKDAKQGVMVLVQDVGFCSGSLKA